MREHTYYVYIITNLSNTVLYIGMTSDLARRMDAHQRKIVSGFASKYNCRKLVYYDATDDVMSAIEREKELKGWVRRKKIALIEQMNPQWRDLSEDF
ncbi:GIY-YIG nuclease family protein [Candidatus Uhrbacteria bacterium]|nr:GIY-YIG nuclease family protein [Candidatus Uhrbacteria bacterium]